MKHFFRLFLSAALLLGAAAGCSDDEGTGGGNPKPGFFKNTVLEKSSSYVRIKTTPKDLTTVYYAHLLEKETFRNKWNSDVKRFMADYLTHLMEDEGYTYDEAIESVQMVGEQTWEVTRLTPETTYIVFTVKMGDNGIPSSQPEFTEFTTEAVQMVDCTFQLTVSDITLTSATISVVPSDKKLTYVAGAFSLDNFPTDPNEQLALAQEFAMLTIASAAEQNMIDYYDAIPYVTTTDDAEKTLDPGSLHPDRLYYAIAVGIDADGFVVTQPAFKTFNTAEAEMTDMTFEVEVDATAVGATLNVVPSDEEAPYYVGVFTKSSLGDFSDDQIVSSLIKDGAMGDYIGSNEIYDWAEFMLLPSTDYVAIVFGCDEWATTPVKRVPFTTLPAGDAAACTFDMMLEGRNFKAEFMIEPSDESVFYLYTLVPVADYPDDETEITGELSMILEEIQAEFPDASLTEMLYELCYRGMWEDSETVDPGESYYLCAFAVDALTGEPQAIHKQAFDIPDWVRSGATITLRSEKHYDGKALYDYDPDMFRQGKDNMAYSVLNFETNDEAVTWYAACYAGDLRQSTDINIIKNLVDRGFPLYGKQLVAWSYFKDVKYMGSIQYNTILAVAEDADGIYGPVFKQLYQPTEDSCSPISEVTNPASATAVPFSSVSTMAPRAKKPLLVKRAAPEQAGRTSFRFAEGAEEERKPARESLLPADLVLPGTYGYGPARN